MILKYLKLRVIPPQLWLRKSSKIRSGLKKFQANVRLLVNVLS